MEQQQQEQDGAPLDETAGAAPPVPYTALMGSRETAANPGCTNCEAFLQGQCPSNQLLFHICKLRSGSRAEKEEAARKLGELSKESVRARHICAAGLRTRRMK